LNIERIQRNASEHVEVLVASCRDVE